VNALNRVGGIAGSNSGSITNSSAAVNVHVSWAHSGGIAGVNLGEIKNCYTTGAVSGGSNVGGISGYNTHSIVANSYSTAAVSGGGAVGGIAGMIITSATVSDSVALNPGVTINGTGTAYGRIVGQIIFDATLENDVALNTMAITNNNGPKPITPGHDTLDGADITATAIHTDGTIGNRFTAPIWTTQNGKLPGFGVTVDMPEHIEVITFPGAGTATSPYLITTPAQLALLAELVNAGNTNYSTAHYRLEADLDLTAYGSNFNDGRGWHPIGITNTNFFRGVFDGNGYTITNLYINDPSGNNIGLFGFVDGRTGGGIIKNLSVSGEVTGVNFVGGVVGVSNGGIVSNVSSWVDVSGAASIGGVVGRNLHTTQRSAVVENSYAVGNVSGTGSIGGIVGWNDAIVRDNAALNVSVAMTGTSNNLGRVVGFTNSTNLVNNIAFSGMNITRNGVQKPITPGPNTLDGIGLDGSAIHTDGTIGDRFTAPIWTTKPGKLPGFGVVVDMPEHITTNPVTALTVIPVHNDPSLTIGFGETIMFMVVTNPGADLSTITWTVPTGAHLVQVNSSNTGGLFIVEGRHVGTFAVRAEANGVAGSRQAHVVGDPVAVTEISVNPTPVIQTGQAININALTNLGGDLDTITWQILSNAEHNDSNNSIARIVGTNTGGTVRIEGFHPGTIVVEASANGVADTHMIYIEGDPIDVTVLSLSPSASPIIQVGETFTFLANVNPGADVTQIVWDVRTNGHLVDIVSSDGPQGANVSNTQGRWFTVKALEPGSITVRAQVPGIAQNRVATIVGGVNVCCEGAICP